MNWAGSPLPSNRKSAGSRREARRRIERHHSLELRSENPGASPTRLPGKNPGVSNCRECPVRVITPRMHSEAERRVLDHDLHSNGERLVTIREARVLIASGYY